MRWIRWRIGAAHHHWYGAIHTTRTRCNWSAAVAAANATETARRRTGTSRSRCGRCRGCRRCGTGSRWCCRRRWCAAAQLSHDIHVWLICWFAIMCIYLRFSYLPRLGFCWHICSIDYANNIAIAAAANIRTHKMNSQLRHHTENVSNKTL